MVYNLSITSSVDWGLASVYLNRIQRLRRDSEAAQGVAGEVDASAAMGLVQGRGTAGWTATTSSPVDVIAQHEGGLLQSSRGDFA